MKWSRRREQILGWLQQSESSVEKVCCLGFKEAEMVVPAAVSFLGRQLGWYLFLKQLLQIICRPCQGTLAQSAFSRWQCNLQGLLAVQSAILWQWAKVSFSGVSKCAHRGLYSEMGTGMWDGLGVRRVCWKLLFYLGFGLVHNEFFSCICAPVARMCSWCGNWVSPYNPLLETLRKVWMCILETTWIARHFDRLLRVFKWRYPKMVTKT